MSDKPGSRIAVIGAGYVGLTTAVCLAHMGHSVVCGESDQAKVARLNAGEPTILEASLPERLREGLDSGRLKFVHGAQAAITSAEFIFLCVPTPQNQDGSADTSSLETVAVQIGPLLEPGAVVVTKSTVPVGSTTVVEALLKRSDVPVVSNPEFLREGTAIYDCLHPERIVVGADNPRAAARVGALFASTRAPVIVTDAASAETIKYASNAFLATKLTFVNAVAHLCEAVGADVRDVLLGMAYDRRIGFDYLRPGPGWGGSCLPKDTRALLALAERAGYDFALLRGTIQSNETHVQSVVDKIRIGAGGSLDGTQLAVWGLTFKAGTDDRRDSPAIQITRAVLEGGANVGVYDPTVQGGVSELAGGLRVHSDPYAACQGAHALVVLTEWDEFRSVDFARVRAALAKPVIVDARNLLDPGPIKRLGFHYVGIGRR